MRLPIRTAKAATTPTVPKKTTGELLAMGRDEERARVAAHTAAALRYGGPKAQGLAVEAITSGTPYTQLSEAMYATADMKPRKFRGTGDNLFGAADNPNSAGAELKRALDAMFGAQQTKG